MILYIIILTIVVVICNIWRYNRDNDCHGKELLGYIEARKQIYIPTYKWVLENKVAWIIEKLREASKTKTIVLLDYDTNADVENAKKPLSHASLIKAYVEGIYPYEDSTISTDNRLKGEVIELDLFNQ